jgi:hypothetical protein
MRITENPMAGSSRIFILVWVLVLTFSLSALVASAQDTDTRSQPDPLRPSDTSSPRATLHSFLTNTNEVDYPPKGSLGYKSRMDLQSPSSDRPDGNSLPPIGEQTTKPGVAQ